MRMTPSSHHVRGLRLGLRHIEEWRGTRWSPRTLTQTPNDQSSQPQTALTPKIFTSTYMILKPPSTSEDPNPTLPEPWPANAEVGAGGGIDAKLSLAWRQVKTRIWPGLSYVCHIRSTAEYSHISLQNRPQHLNIRNLNF